MFFVIPIKYPISTIVTLISPRWVKIFWQRTIRSWMKCTKVDVLSTELTKNIIFEGLFECGLYLKYGLICFRNNGHCISFIVVKQFYGHYFSLVTNEKSKSFFFPHRLTNFFFFELLNQHLIFPFTFIFWEFNGTNKTHDILQYIW